MTKNAYLSFLRHEKQLLFLTFCDTIAGIRASFWTHVNTDGLKQKDRQTWKLKYLFETISMVVAAEFYSESDKLV